MRQAIKLAEVPDGGKFFLEKHDDDFWWKKVEVDGASGAHCNARHHLMTTYFPPDRTVWVEKDYQ